MAQTQDDALGPAGPRKLLDLLEQYQSSVTRSSPQDESAAREIEAAYLNLEAHLTRFSQQLAHEHLRRRDFVNSGALSTVLESLNTFYPTFQQLQDARPPSEEQDQQDLFDGRPAVGAQRKQQDPYYRACHIATLYMRSIRNAMAACSEAQYFVGRHFDLVVPFLDNITRFHTLNDPDAALLSRSAVQMLSNLITTNHDVQATLWPHIVITDRDQNKLVLKFLSSPDTATQSAAQILLINFLRMMTSLEVAHERCHQLCTSASGQQLLQSLLSTSESIMLRTASAIQDASSQEYEPESEIEGLEESLGFIYTIFALLFERGHSSMLVSALAPSEEISSSASSSASESDRPIISSSQLTLLKLLDSWLHLQQKQVAESLSNSGDHAASSSEDESANQPVFQLSQAPSFTQDKASRRAGLAGLMDIFVHLSRFARSAMASGIAKDGASADQQPQDRRLIGAHHGVLLLLQSLLSISLTADGWSDEHSSLDESLAQEGVQAVEFREVSRVLLSDMRDNQAFVDELVALLDQTHQYAPALSPFRPTDAQGTSRPGQTASDEGTQTRPLPQGHALSSTGRAANEAKGTQPSYGFDHLKRDIVRVMGSLVYAPTHASSKDTGQMPSSDRDTQTSAMAFTKTQIRQVQDRIRDGGGLFHVLNMTVLDERNPYMREHAIFALRYLLAGNAESQSLVGSLQPTQPQDGTGGMQLPML